MSSSDVVTCMGMDDLLRCHRSADSK